LLTLFLLNPETIILENNKARLIKGSITDPDLLQQSFRDVDYVFHQAAIPGVPANIMAAESEEAGIFNIGSGEAVTINELAEVIVNLCGKNLDIVHVEPREGDIMHSRASVERAGRIGYKPEYGLEEGLKETIGWSGNEQI